MRILATMILCGVFGTSASAQTYGHLLSGDTLDGWTKVGGAADFTIKNGVVTGVTQGSANTFLHSHDSYTNFILRFETRLQGDADTPNNSGFQIRSINDNGTVRGYQIDMDARQTEKSATVFEEGNRRLTLHDGSEFEALRNSYVPFDDGWNKVEVIANGNTIQTRFNGIDGKAYVETRELGSEAGKYPIGSGFLALQLHGVGEITADGLTVQWRNITIEEITVPEPDTLTLLGFGPLLLTRHARSSRSW